MGNYDHDSFEFNPQMEAYEAEQFEWSGEAEWGGEAEVFNESEVMELGGQLLGVNNEAELDQFIGDLINNAGQALGQVVRSPLGQAVGGYLKGAAKAALPLAGQALGSYIGGPLGAKIGSGFATAAGDALGLESEAWSGETADIRNAIGANQFVKLAGDAVKSALIAPPGANPKAIAKAAVKAAAEKHAPHLLEGSVKMPESMGHSGRWIRQGQNIIIVNCQPARS